MNPSYYGVNVKKRPAPPARPPENKSLDLIWPRNERESDIIKQQNNLHNYFHWYEAGIGFVIATSFWGVCNLLWGAF